LAVGGVSADPPERGALLVARVANLSCGECFIARQGKFATRRLPQPPGQQRRAPRQRRPSQTALAGQDLDQRDGASAGAGGTRTSTGRGGVSVWTPLGGASLPT